MTTKSEPSSPSANERTVRRRGAATLPQPEREKKTEKKLETPVLVAIISAVVTLITAILGSPMFLAMVNKPVTPAPTAVVELVASQNSLVPNNPSGAELFTADYNPTESGTDFLEPASTPPGESPTSAPPLLEPTFTSTVLPPINPDSPTPAPPSSFPCIAADLWFPYPTTLTPEISDDCWDLAEWGFSADNGGLVLVHNPVQDQQRGIYLPISGDVDIHFILQLNEFRTRVNKVGFLNFGIVQNDPFSIYTGGYLSYQQPAPGKASPVRVLISGSKQATQKISVQEAGFQHDVLFSIQDDLMVVYLNGEQTGDPVSLPTKDRAFWIGYVLPSKSELEVMITDFSMQTR